MITLVFLLFTLVALEPVLVAGAPGTQKDLDNAFLRKCATYKQQVRANTKNCQNLLTIFKKIWVGKDPCSVPRSAYKPFVDAASITIPKGKSLFWSGAKADAQRFAQRGMKMHTLETTFIGSVVDGLSFCGQVVTAEDKTGINFEKCPDWMSCTNLAMKSFWGAASEWFAKSANGPITVLLGGWRKPAYSPQSIFRSIELPALRTGKSGVTEVHVWMVDEKLSNCKEASLALLKKDVAARGFPFTCTDNPNLFGRPLNDVKKTPVVKTSGSFIKSNLQTVSK